MHSKNPFSKDYDFDQLTSIHAPLIEHVFTNDYGTKTIKFGNQDAVKALNSALLKTHYNIDWDIPNGYLCPPIPGRLDYLLHVNDLLNKKKANVLDLGTGANLIYPILA
ncbi:MAG: RlmF-related methyltransferase, partial [Flavobacteriales bacterium]